MPLKKNEDSDTEEATIQLSETMRGLITLFLVLHLFCIFAAAMAGLSSSPSPLQTRFLSVVRPYVRVLNFELMYAQFNLNLAYGGSEDADYRFEYHADTAGTSAAEGEQPERWDGLPDVGWRGSDRYHRYQRLNRHIAVLDQVGGQASAPMQAAAARLVQGIAKRLWTEGKIKSGDNVRCRQHRPIFMDAIAGGNNEQSDPNSSMYINDAYSATIIVDEHSRVHTNKTSSSGEVAPAGSEGSD